MRVPKGLSLLAHHDPDALIHGLEEVPPGDRPPVAVVRNAFQVMVAIGTGLLVLGAWFAIVWWRKRELPASKWFFRAAVAAGFGAPIALEAGWIVTEVGRQPWIVWRIMRVGEAVTTAPHIRVGLYFLVAVYALLTWGTIFVLRRLATGAPTETCRVTTAEAVLALMWLGVTAYALLAGADFGAGLWDLLAGGPERGSAQRTLIAHAIGPVWEANHVWLIFVLVMLWTGFPEAFAAIASSLYVPLTLVATGVILRGAGFAFRKEVTGVRLERLFGATFAASSVITPFFLGTVAGAIASGRVPAGIAEAHPVRSFVNPTSVLGGALAVVVCAYLAAVYLTGDAHRSGEDELVEAFRRRALASGAVAGALVLGGIGILRADAPELFDGLTGPGTPARGRLGGGRARVAGLRVEGALRDRPAGVRRRRHRRPVGLGGGPVPGPAPGELTIAEAAAAPVALRAVLLSLAVGAVLVLPGLAALFVLAQREVAGD